MTLDKGGLHAAVHLDLQITLKVAVKKITNYPTYRLNLCNFATST
ncbi:hypothetical protein EVA_05029 [gut metagenome]|uniref:Uncharacterized protein n=1 Tax=gut metagenome TaxID=749906 RepID=J9D2L1_9ZZZZ